jgi:hypothetical protein
MTRLLSWCLGVLAVGGFALLFPSISMAKFPGVGIRRDSICNGGGVVLPTAPIWCAFADLWFCCSHNNFALACGTTWAGAAIFLSEYLPQRARLWLKNSHRITRGHPLCSVRFVGNRTTT